MKKIKLFSGEDVLVDDDVFEWAKNYRWCNSSGYAGRSIYRRETQNCTVTLLHREIMCPQEGKEVDHKNGNKLDNRRENLRIVTRSQNIHNNFKLRSNSSGFKGVTWDKEREKWRAQLEINHHYKYIGRFDDKVEAAKAYDKVAQEIWGEYARTNFGENRV